MRTGTKETAPTFRQYWKNPHPGSGTPIAAEIPRKDWLAGLPLYFSTYVPPDIPHIIAVGGGKGGVGKSIISANLAARLGQAGHKVVLVDLDLGGANLHTYFGLGVPTRTLTDYIIYDRVAFKDLLLPTPVQGVYLAAGGRDEAWSNADNIRSDAFCRLWADLLATRTTMDADFIVVDLGAGNSRHTIDFFCSAHVGIVTVLPEPTSIENAYAFLKTTLWRLLENVGAHLNQHRAAEELKKALFDNEDATLKGSYTQKLAQLEGRYPHFVQHLYQAFAGRSIGFVVNQIRSQKDIDIGPSMEKICNKYFGFRACSLGYLNYDDAAWKSLRNRRLLVMDFPHTILTRRLSEVAGCVLSSLGYS